ncbi:MAG TPA: hypothetical protein VM760_01200 [Sphingomicrobium sp.]|jgi:hypothetical protein|nr:hypothetical protein [Sphingomicrobium sp.]
MEFPPGHDGETNLLVRYRQQLPIPRYWLRRSFFISVLALTAWGGATGALPTLPALWDGIRDRAAEMVENDPEPALMRMVEDGKIRPARQSDIDRWLSAAQLDEESRRNLSLYPDHSFVVLERIRLPGDMYGAHSRSFIIPPGVPLPSGETAHNDFYFMASGTCVGSAPGCGH